MWLARPLLDFSLLAAARDTIFLLELSHILQWGLEEPVRRASQAVLQSISSLNLSDQEAGQLIPSPIVPAVMENI